MVDRIKFSVDNCNLKEDILVGKFYIKTKTENGFMYSFKNKFSKGNDDENSEEKLQSGNKYNQKYKKFFIVKYYEYNTPKRISKDEIISTELVIYRNLRKAYFDEGKTNDLKYKDFLKAIDNIRIEFGLNEKSIWNARVTTLELGVTLRFKKNMRGILSCFNSFKDLTHKNIYGKDGIAFIGENYSVVIYDKLEKMTKNKELFKNSDNRVALKNKIAKKNYFLRLELQIEKVSGFYRSEFNGKINRLKHIRENWNFIGTAVYNLYFDVKYLDVLSPEVKFSLKGLKTEPMDKYLKFMGMKLLGSDVFFEQIIPILDKEKSNRSRFRDSYRNFYNNYKREFRVDYSSEFEETLQKRIESLKKK